MAIGVDRLAALSAHGYPIILQCGLTEVMHRTQVDGTAQLEHLDARGALVVADPQRARIDSQSSSGREGQDDRPEERP